MIEVIYGDNRELAHLEGKTVAEVRKEYEDEFDIPGRAQAVINGVSLKKNLESETRLEEGDELCFVTRPRVRTPMLVTALLVALALTSGVFAYTFTTSTVSLAVVSSETDFASVTGNTSDAADWDLYGLFRGTITGNASMFDINCTTSTYAGDLVATVSIANADQLSKVYRVLAMKIVACDSDMKPLDINADNLTNEYDFALLTLQNGSVDIFIHQTSADTYHILLDSGYYVSHIAAGWGEGARSPLFFCDVGQR